MLVMLGAGNAVKAQDSLKTTQLDEMVFTGSRMATPKEKSGKMIYKISGEDIQKSGVRSLPDLLNRVPGVQMDGNFGAPGTNIDYFVRGAGSKRTLILIDGVPFNDPSGIDLTYDLRLVDMNNIESIEVLRGGLSSLYGSGAAAAVISIKTKSAKSGELSGNVSLEAGSFNTKGGSVNANGRVDKVTYGFSGSYKSSDGFSAAKETGGANFDKDGMTSENASLNVGYDVTEKINLQVSGALDQFENEFDAFAFTDDPTSGSVYLQNRIGLSGNYSGEETQFSASIFQNNLERRFNYGGFSDDYEAQNNQGNFQLTQEIGSLITVIAGVDLQRLNYEQPTQTQVDFTSQAPYLSGILELGNLTFQAGTRINKHSNYGTKTVYNLNPSYFFDLGSTTLKLLANYSTNYITPSLYQLNGPFGNPELKPEISKGWDFGTSVYQENLTLNAVYFQRKDNRPIDFQSFLDDDFNFIGGEYFNAGRQLWVEGVEFDGQYSIGKFDIRGTYTWLNNIQGNLRQRVPRIKYGLGGTLNYSKNGGIALDYTWTGKRKQNDPATFETVATDSFGLVDLSANHQFGRFALNGAINNLLNEKYEAILGFTTMGRNYTIGLTMQLGK